MKSRSSMPGAHAGRPPRGRTPAAARWAALWWFLIATVGLAPRSSAAETLELIPLHHLWSYEISGADLGTGWKEPAFNDSPWPSGRGVLADENTSPLVQTLTNTVLTRIGTNGEYKITDYFRAHFQVPALSPGWFLIASNLVDDGAVVYLNGVELFRLNMPAGPVTATTLAVQSIGTGQEGVFVVTNLAADTLVPGDNLLAVEVHQPYLTSSDVTLGLVLLYAPQEPLRIITQPAGRALPEGSAGALSVEVSGSLPRYQWFKDGVALPDATQPTLRLPNTLRADAAQYYVVVTNQVNAVTSRVASLTVVLDTQGPTLVSARRTAAWVECRFSEPIDPVSAINPALYRITTSDGRPVEIVDVQYFGSAAVAVLTAAPLPAGTNYFLTVNGVGDEAGNLIAPGSSIAIATVVTNVPLAAVWRYNDSGAELGTGWRAPGYDDSAWRSGAGLLYYDPNLNLQGPAVRQTLLRVTNDSGAFWTHYFRLRFTNPGSPVDAGFLLRYYLDDGAVFYLNGQEFYRVGMPAGAIDSLTHAQSSGAEGVFSAAVVASATNLVSGENLLAVEVHQFSLSSPTLPDVSFDLELAAEIGSLIDGPPRVLSEPQDTTVREGEAAVFRAQTAGAASVQWLRNGIQIPGATGSLLTLPGAGLGDRDARYSLLVSNSVGSIASRAARLIVLPDLTAPRLLTARMGTNDGLLTLAFSKPLELGSASSMANYTITNELGVALAVLSATVTNGTNVILATGPRRAGERYVVGVVGVRDRSAAGNLVFVNGQVGIDHEVVLVTYSSAWRYDDSGTNRGTTWRQPGYDDTAWPLGPGLLGFDDNAALPAPIVTILTPPEFRGPTYYFRTVFNLAAQPPAGSVLRLRHVIDDGAVLYLNGQEVHRIRVPAGQNYTTLATQTVEASLEGPFEIAPTTLRPGLNVLAAEVHQSAAISADVVFGAELVQAFPAVPAGPVGPMLNLRTTDGSVMITWDAWDFALETAPALAGPALSPSTGPWVPAAHPTIPYPVLPTGEARLFRLRMETH